MAFLVCLLFRESIGVAITKSFVIFVRKFFVSSIIIVLTIYGDVGMRRRPLNEIHFQIRFNHSPSTSI